MIKNFLIILGIAFSVVVVTIGCGSQFTNLSKMTPQERFEMAKESFAKREYVTAQYFLQSLTRLNLVTEFSDSAQYMLGEAHLLNREYILAQSEFERLIKNLPGSPLVRDSKFKLAECFNKLSPQSSLDQTYTFRAIVAYQDFLLDYPNDPVYDQLIKDTISELKSKLAKKDYETGALYFKQRDYISAIYYFDSVIKEYGDTEYVGNSWFYKGDCHYNMNELKKAEEIFTLFLDLFPANEFISEGRERLVKIKSVISDSTSS